MVAACATWPREVYPAGEHNIPVTISGLPDGTYVAVVRSGTGRILQTIRMVKTQ